MFVKPKQFILTIQKQLEMMYFLKKKNFILRVLSLMLEKSESNNHTSKINVFPVLYTIFFLLGDQKMDFFFPTRGNEIHFMTQIANFYLRSSNKPRDGNINCCPICYININKL